MIPVLRDEQIKEGARREQLKGRELDLQKMIDILTAQQQYIEDLKKQNADLQKENRQLLSMLGPVLGAMRDQEQGEEMGVV